jgi:hypothetical protein
MKKLLIVLFLISLLSAQYHFKCIVNMPYGIYDGPYIVCGDTDHDSLNELIFIQLVQQYVYAWQVWEYRPMNQYELVFADTGAFPPPPGITTGNFEPEDIGDIDSDSLTDLVGPNRERANDSTFNIVTTHESPNYLSYPENLSWWTRYSYNEVQSAPFFSPPDLDCDNLNELLFLAEGVGVTHIFENRGNNQNQLVWSRYQVGAWSFAFGDFDLDGHKEFVTANLSSSGRVSVYENIGLDQYELIYQDTVNIPNSHDVFSGNDVDEHPEFFIRFARLSGRNWNFFLYRWKATGNNIYQRTIVDQVTHTFVATPGSMRSCCGDIDGDEIDEIVWSIGSNVFVYKAIENNQFQQIWSWVNPTGSQVPSAFVNIYDMNRNGYNEIVISGNGTTKIYEIEAVQILSPNGSEVFHADSSELIRWQTFHPPRCDSLSLFYSIDNGRTYNLITSGLSGNDTSYLWTVPNVNSDSCKIKIIAYGPGWQYDESDGIFSIMSTGITEIAMDFVPAMTLGVKVYPNPVKALSVIRYSLPAEGKVSLQLYDISGRLVKTLVNEDKKPGSYSITLNTKILSAGVYFIFLQTESKRIIERLVIIK